MSADRRPEVGEWWITAADLPVRIVRTYHRIYGYPVRVRYTDGLEAWLPASWIERPATHPCFGRVDPITLLTTLAWLSLTLAAIWAVAR